MGLGAFAPLPLRLGGTVTEEQFTAAQHARLCADLVALKRTCPICCISVRRSNASSVQTLRYTGQNGSGLTYAPTISFNSGVPDLHVTLTFAPYTDAYGVSYPINISRGVIIAGDGTGGGAIYTGKIISILNNQVVFTVVGSLSGLEVSSYTVATLVLW